MNRPKKVALLGFDCALTSLVRMHIEEGLCPNFKKIFENGVVCENCLVPFPTITPPNWTSMATGAWPGTNNITDFWRHYPGTTPESCNTHSVFNWNYVQAESIWEAAERGGKKSVILNYPMSNNVHKKLKNSVVVGGGALTPGLYMDGEYVSEVLNIPKEQVNSGTAGYTFCADLLVTTEPFPGNTARIKFEKATGWKNVDDMGEMPLEASFTQTWANSFFKVKPVTWYVLVRDLGNGYEYVSVSPSKDMAEAFFTITPQTWSSAFGAEATLEDGTTKKLRGKAKLLSMTDEADNFSLILPHFINIDGEYWCNPPSKAVNLNKGDNIPTANTSMTGLSTGLFSLDTWMEFIAIHYDWLGDAAEALLKDGDWDLFYSHAHPTDYIYHALMTDLDPDTCSSKAAYDIAWAAHRTLYKHADRYLGRLLALPDEDTLVTLISDHGATPDGPAVDMFDLLGKAGLCYTRQLDLPDFSYMAENMQAVLNALAMRVDTSKSKAMPQRSCYIYINLKGRDPEGIVDQADYHTVQREICDALYTYIHPKTGKRPVALALPKEEAMILGLWGDQVGDVVYALYPEYGTQHGQILPTSSYGIGSLKTLCVYYGPKVGVKKGVSLNRICNLIDLVPTFCYMTGWPIPQNVEGGVVYQIMEDPDWFISAPK